ncbi:hypothetical protein DL770_004967 [Monosporascus sp. CRB-9-2]|nr:hypothetical protein DL770_004967 [Monosporascus sp. CRB-9-2]
MGRRRRNTIYGREALTESVEDLVVGTTQLYEADGQIRYIPMPTPDPKGTLTHLFSPPQDGALAASSEAIIGALLPVFMLEYGGVDPKILGTSEDLTDLDTLIAGLDGPPTWQISLLSTAPMIVNGVASWVLIPLSIAVGRRPVILLCGALAWAGGIWAATSGGLKSHIAARCFQGIGAGTIDALIPLIIQDFMFIHERNKAVAAVNASTGLIIVGLGVGSPLIVTRMSWRWVYGVTSIIGFATWISIILCLPETRRVRTPDELAGKVVYPLRPGETRPRLDHSRYGYRTPWVEFGLFNAGTEWRRAATAVWLSVKTAIFPNVLWCVALNAALTGAFGAVQQVSSSVLISSGWRFEELGLFVLPIVIASPLVWLFGGFIADRVSNAMARRSGGRREPEAHLVNLILPVLAGFAGPMVFGSSAQNVGVSLPSWFVLIGVFILSFASSTITTLISVYLVESYPNFAGPVLVTVSTFRLIFGFLLNFNVTTWIDNMGFFGAFSVYSGTIFGVALLLPVIFFYGKRIRHWSAGRLERTENKAKKMSDEEGGSMEDIQLNGAKSVFFDGGDSAGVYSIPWPRATNSDRIELVEPKEGRKNMIKIGKAS